MGIYSDILASANSIDIGNGDGRVAIDKALVRELNALQDRQGDLDYPSGYDAADEVQELAQHTGTPSGGTFTITVTLKNGESFTTAGIAYDANAATIESAIDTAATSASITDWTNGDISVAGGPLTSDAITLTFDGDSVSSQNHPAITADGDNITDGDVGAVSTTTEGQSKRTAWAILKSTGAFSGSIPDQGEDPSGLTADTDRSTNPFLPSQPLLKALAKEAAISDGNENVESSLLTVFGL